MSRSSRSSRVKLEVVRKRDLGARRKLFLEQSNGCRSAHRIEDEIVEARERA